MPEDDKAQLTTQLGRLHGHADQLHTYREKILARSQAQLDSVTGVIDQVNDHVEADTAGGILGHRRLKTLLSERNRLERLVANQRRLLYGS